jgi:hypothetical protein
MKAIRPLSWSVWVGEHSKAQSFPTSNSLSSSIKLRIVSHSRDEVLKSKGIRI